MKENYQIYLLYQFHWRAQSAGWDPQLPNKKMKTMFPSNMSKSRRLTSTFFPMNSLFHNACQKTYVLVVLVYDERWTKSMYFGKYFKSFSCAPIKLNDAPFEFVTEWKYQGVYLKSNSNFTCSLTKSRSSFYRNTSEIAGNDAIQRIFSFQRWESIRLLS